MQSDTSAKQIAFGDRNSGLGSIFKHNWILILNPGALDINQDPGQFLAGVHLISLFTPKP